VMARRTARFLAAAMTVGRCIPRGGDGRAHNTVPRHGGGGGRGGGGLFPGAALKAEEERDSDGGEGGGAGRLQQRRKRMAMVTAEEEQDSAALGCGGEGRVDGGDGVDPAATTVWRQMGWRRRRRRGRGKFW
jgi:hypothetical protein